MHIKSMVYMQNELSKAYNSDIIRKEIERRKKEVTLWISLFLYVYQK